MIRTETLHRPEPHACASASKNFTGRLAVVTGASSGIGRAIAEELAAHGASVCLLGRHPEALGDVARQAGGIVRLTYPSRAQLQHDEPAIHE